MLSGDILSHYESNNLENENMVVTVCYTRQTSANLTAFMRVLGYDAKSLVFGTNGMIYNIMNDHKWLIS